MRQCPECYADEGSFHYPTCSKSVMKDVRNTPVMSNGELPYLCPNCKLIFATRELYFNHRIERHNDIPLESPQPVDYQEPIDVTLKERGSRYGSFIGHADITQQLKSVMHNTPNWEKLHSDQKECLEMVAHKVGRILNGDPNYHDSWHDIVGYCKLVADRLLGIIK